MSQIFSEISMFLMPLVTYFVGWFFGGKRKSNAESLSVEIVNIRTVVEEYKGLFEQMKSDLKDSRQEYNEHLKECRKQTPLL